MCRSLMDLYQKGSVTREKVPSLVPTSGLYVRFYMNFNGEIHFWRDQKIK